MSAIIRLSVSTSIGVIYLYMSEVFTSAFRGIGVAVACILGRIGAMMAPFVSSIMENYDIYP